MNIKSIEKAPLRRKKVIVRVGFDVPSGKRGEVLDAFRIERTLPTLQYLRKLQCTIELIGHRGEPDGKRIRRDSLFPVAQALSKLIRKQVVFIPDVLQMQKYSKRLRPGDIALAENLRFHIAEQNADSKFAKTIASAGDAFVNDDFSTSHRAHASFVKIPMFLPSYAGFTVLKEIEMLDRLADNPRHPFAIVVGGAKVKDKLGVVSRLLKSADIVLAGGVAASTLLHATGVRLGKSLVDDEMSAAVSRRIAKSPKVSLPIDVVVARSRNAAKNRISDVHSVPRAMAIFDIGPQTVRLYSFLLSQARTVFWAGALGYTENPVFRASTAALARSLGRRHAAFSVAGGGDTIAALHSVRLANRFSFLSTGGGATLAYLSGETLPGLKALI